MKRILVVAATFAWTATALAQGATEDVARRAVLYEEGVGQGDKAEGQVTWRTERTADPSAPPGDITIRGDIVIPSRGARIAVSFRRNFDPSLSASHTVQVDFKPPLGFAGGSIKQVMGLMLKTSEQAKGVPIDAVSVKSTTHTF